MTPRVAVQFAICTSGRFYCSMSQCNTDSNTYCLFISKLAKKLTKEDRAWRENCLLLIDSARYQTCAESVRHMRALGFRVVVSAPYSYAAAPVEYAFAFLKDRDLERTS